MPTDIMIVAAAALIDSAGQVLIQRRPAHSTMAGLWEFPGGKVEPGETPEAALARELDEELGIRIDPDRAVPACFASAPLGDRHLLLLLYLVRDWTGTPAPRVAESLDWVAPAALRGRAMPPADRPLIPLIEALV